MNNNYWKMTVIFGFDVHERPTKDENIYQENKSNKIKRT